MTSNFRIAIAGLGTVGGGVVKALAARGDELSGRAGRKLEIIGVSARDKNKVRGFEVTGWTADPLSLAKGDADVVVELIGGDEGVARQLVENEHRIRQAARNVKKFLSQGSNGSPADAKKSAKKNLAPAK